MKEYKLKIHGKEFEVAVGPAGDNKLAVNVNGTEYEVEVESSPEAETPVVSTPVRRLVIADTPKAGQVSSAGKVIKSPLPGVILALEVSKGESVKRGQRIAVIEAMKMENDILAEANGTIVDVHVSQGESVLEGAKIVTIG